MADGTIIYEIAEEVVHKITNMHMQVMKFDRPDNDQRLDAVDKTKLFCKYINPVTGLFIRPVSCGCKTHASPSSKFLQIFRDLSSQIGLANKRLGKRFKTNYHKCCGMEYSSQGDYTRCY